MDRELVTGKCSRCAIKINENEIEAYNGHCGQCFRNNYQTAEMMHQQEEMMQDSGQDH